MDLTEGGIRVPWIAHWPEYIKPNQTSSQQCITMDWTATILEIANAIPSKNYPLDGISMLQVLNNPAIEFERPLYWRMHYRSQRAARIGEWKYLKVDDHEYLFNLSQDERERANLGERMPELLKKMQDQWKCWDTEMLNIPSDANVSVGYSLKNMPLR
jgi:arylsulfatase A-like enzyme